MITSGITNNPSPTNNRGEPNGIDIPTPVLGLRSLHQVLEVLVDDTYIVLVVLSPVSEPLDEPHGDGHQVGRLVQTIYYLL